MMMASLIGLLLNSTFVSNAQALEPLLIKNAEVTEMIFADPESVEGSGPYFAFNNAYPIPVCPHLELSARSAFIQTLTQLRMNKTKISSIGVYFPSDKTRTCVGIMKL